MMPIHDLINYYAPLHDDIEYCLIGIETGENTDFWKRSYLRCLCTFIEARIHLLKLELKTNDHLINHSTLSPETLKFLDGTEWNIKSNGEISSRTRIVPPVDELKAVIKILGSAYPNLLWDFSSQRWDRVKNLYNSRNNLVHPKKSTDLLISHEKIQEFELLRIDFNTWSSSIYREAWGNTESES